MLRKLFYGQRPLSTIPCGQWWSHPPVQRNANHHNGKPWQGLQDCQWTGRDPCPQPWENSGGRVPRQGTGLYSSCNPCHGRRGWLDNLPFYAGLCKNNLQVTGAEPETPVALAGLPHCACRPGLCRPLPGPQEHRPFSPWMLVKWWTCQSIQPMDTSQMMPVGSPS